MGQTLDAPENDSTGGRAPHRISLQFNAGGWPSRWLGEESLTSHFLHNRLRFAGIFVFRYTVFLLPLVAGIPGPTEGGLLPLRKHIICGIDPGLRRTGYGVVCLDDDEDTISVIDAGVI